MQGKEVPFTLFFLSRFFLPVQGFFNVMVYMRPHIISLRRSNPSTPGSRPVPLFSRAVGITIVQVKVKDPISNQQVMQT